MARMLMPMHVKLGTQPATIYVTLSVAEKIRTGRLKAGDRIEFRVRSSTAEKVPGIIDRVTDQNYPRLFISYA